MRIYDVTVPLRPDMPTYPGEPAPRLEPLKLIAKGNSANVTAVSFGAHSGTHVDAPHHFIDGAATIDQLPLEALVGPARVLELTGVERITAAHLESSTLPAGSQRLLLKTRNSRLWSDSQFHSDFVHITPDAAHWLVDHGYRLVGIDYLSIEQFRSPTHEVHKTLLAAGVVILEGLDLRQVPPGDYFLIFLPLRLVGGDGAPARALLMDRPP